MYYTTITKQVHITYINHGGWHVCLRLCNLCVGGNASTQRKPTFQTWLPYNHPTLQLTT